MFLQEVHLLGLGLQRIAFGVIAGLLRLGGSLTGPMACKATCIATSSLLQLRDRDLIGARTQNAIPASSKTSCQITVLLGFHGSRVRSALGAVIFDHSHEDLLGL